MGFRISRLKFPWGIRKGNRAGFTVIVSLRDCDMHLNVCVCVCVCVCACVCVCLYLWRPALLWPWGGKSDSASGALSADWSPGGRTGTAVNHSGWCTPCPSPSGRERRRGGEQSEDRERVRGGKKNQPWKSELTNKGFGGQRKAF